MRKKCVLLMVVILIGINSVIAGNKPLKIGIIGLSHSHVHWILSSAESSDFEIIAVVESGTALASRYFDQYSLKKNILFENISLMLKPTKPEAVTAFGPISEHLSIVEHCAPLGIHVMVEKPLAVSLGHAEKMKKLAEENNIFLLTNYETTWYSTNHKTFELIHEDQYIGPVRKIIVRSGHNGPKEIGVNIEFLDWLTDPKYNGGGAITDFGCYGANIMTWIAGGKKPISVTALTQQFKPEIYPKVDDEATIIIEYPEMQGIIQASWNWPFSRKDMEVYGNRGYIICDNSSDLRFRNSSEKKERKLNLGERQKPFNNPFSYFAALIRDEIEIKPFSLSSLENNMIVMQILDAAVRSARTGSRVALNPD